MISRCDKPLSPEIKKLTVSVKQYFDQIMITPNIPKHSLIIMDNASYHNILSEHSPSTPQSSKKKIKEWLEHNKVYCRDDCLKAELIEVLKKMAPEPIYAVDEIAATHGHKVLRTPQYHPELQPIETYWGVVKNQWQGIVSLP